MLRYNNVIIDAFGYELPPNVITSDDLEEQLEPLYQALRFQKGQLEALTGIHERRFWDPGFPVARGAVAAGRKALKHAAVPPEEIGMMIYAAVCRDNIEPATACTVCHALGLRPDTQVYDVSNACLGVLNGMTQVANAVELGQIRAGMVVACETSRDVVEATIRRLNDSRDMNFFKKNIATLTGGSGAVAVILSEASVERRRPRLLGGTYRQDNAHHRLCMWGAQTESASANLHFIETDSMGILSNGVRLGRETFRALRPALQWPDDAPDRIVCHQVGETHQRQILEAIGIPKAKDFTTFQYLGNVGSVSLPITAAIASERRFIKSGDRVGFLGIGSGLNCLMLGLQW